MKRLWTILLTTAMSSALLLPVQADVLWVPDNNRFFDQHYNNNEVEHHGRRYQVNSPEGFITVWDAPDGSIVKGQFINGDKLWVQWIYEDWGLIAHYGEDKTIEGWLDMKDMVLLYDHTAFAEDYADQIQPYNGEFADYDGEDKVFNFYEYPGAPEICHWMTATTKFVPELTGAYTNGDSVIQSVFVDENGLTWGYLGYHYGRIDAWFCLDDPDGINDETHTDFPLREVTYENMYDAREPVLPKKAYLPYVLVGGVTGATAGVLFFFYKKKRGG